MFDLFILGVEMMLPVGSVSAVPVGSGPVGPLRRRLIAQIAKRGKVSESVAGQALAEVEAESKMPFLDWLLNGGLEKLIQLVLQLLPLFA